jgi:hypothetical protein
LYTSTTSYANYGGAGGGDEPPGLSSIGSGAGGGLSGANASGSGLPSAAWRAQQLMIQSYSVHGVYVKKLAFGTDLKSDVKPGPGTARTAPTFPRLSSVIVLTGISFLTSDLSVYVPVYLSAYIDQNHVCW